MGTYISEATVRRTVGILAAEISPTDVDATIVEVEKQVPNKFNTVFVPTERIDFLDGDGTNRLLLDMNPILSVRALKIDGNSYDTDTLEVRKESGYIFLGESAETSKFAAGRNKVVVKYLHGTIEHSTTKTTSSADEVAGTDVSVAVGSITDFADKDWVEIFGMDGMREVAKINGTPGGSAIVLDQLILAHESGSTIVKLQINSDFTKYMNIVAGIALVARIIGQSYSDTVGYDLGELHVQKGEPYTQWREAANQLIKERDFLEKTIKIRPRVV